MLLRGIAFAEARRNSARRVFKNRDKTQSSNGCERDVASDLSYDGPLTRHMRTMTMMVRQSPEQPLSPVSPLPFESEAISFVATASKLATVEDVGPKRPEGPIRPSAASLKVSPTARATLQAIRSPKSKLVIPVSTRDAETITDVCSGEELPEVEIISLLEEQIPRYRLRADTLTQFQGYENADWFIPSPALKSEDVDLKLSPDQIRETLNYFRQRQSLFVRASAIPRCVENTQRRNCTMQKHEERCTSC
ncbi:Trafficking kinesin-binding protein 1 [Camponotus japonicus]